MGVVRRDVVTSRLNSVSLIPTQTRSTTASDIIELHKSSGFHWRSPLSDRRIIARLSMFFKIYNNFSAYRDLHSELHSANYIGRHDHACKVSEISASSDREKYSLIPRTIKDWNSLPSSICDELPHSHKKFISLLRDIYSGNA